MDNIYIKLIPNEERAAANHPSWVAPINPKSPEGKKWKLGVKIGDTWYDPAVLILLMKMISLQVD